MRSKKDEETATGDVNIPTIAIKYVFKNTNSHNRHSYFDSISSSAIVVKS